MRRGFTLIELLIVVAIIAILAAIAVPNFLEAQVRSKVSRAYADMRSLATALESYNVDDNRYPVSLWGGSGAEYFRGDPGHSLVVLTTPVAYITALPEDPFTEGSEELDDYGRFRYFEEESYVDFIVDEFGGDPETTWTNLNSEKYDDSKWTLKSKGPDLEWQYQVSGTTQFYSYDPTNGTKSEGDIHRFGP